MYAAGLNPFYASSFGLWSACCAGGLALDSVKKPSFCIADLLQDADALPGSSAGLAVHVAGLRAQQQSPAARDAAMFGARVNPAPQFRHGLQLTSASRTFDSHHELSSVSRTFDPHHELSSVSRTFDPHHAPPPTSKDLKFGIDRILSSDFDPKHKEPMTLRDLTSIVSSRRQSAALAEPPGRLYFSPVAPGGPLGATGPSLGGRQAGPHHFQDTFPGPYAVLTKDTMPQTYKRKRSWSRAVFSNLQRKGLEKRFEIQKYVTKPDRKQLAAMLGLTDAQVKVWFQNRRMKWRHSKEAQAQKDKEKEQTKEDIAEEAEAREGSECESEASESEFEEGDKSDADLSENHHTSVITSGAAPGRSAEAPGPGGRGPGAPGPGGPGLEGPGPGAPGPGGPETVASLQVI